MKEVCRVMVMFLIGVWVSTCQNSANVFLRFMYYTTCKFYPKRKKTARKLNSNNIHTEILRGKCILMSSIYFEMH